MSSLIGDRPHLARDRGQRLLRRIGVDVVFAGTSLSPPLDVEAKEVQALVEVADTGFGRGQAPGFRSSWADVRAESVVDLRE
jgi:hypothetical protein